MCRLVSLLVILALLAGCGGAKLSPEQIATEKKAIETVFTSFWKAYESRDLPAITGLLSTSNDLQIFGTDSAEVFRSPAQFETQMKTEWEIVQSAAWGELRNVATVVSGDGELGSILCEVPAEMTIGGQKSHFLGRLAGTVRKEGGVWKMVLVSVSVATVGQSAAELLAKTKAEMAAPVKE